MRSVAVALQLLAVVVGYLTYQGSICAYDDRPVFYSGALVIFLVGSALARFATRQRKAEEKAAQQDAKRIPCPECREKILPDAKKCRFCGSTIQSPEPQT